MLLSTVINYPIYVHIKYSNIVPYNEMKYFANYYFISYVLGLHVTTVTTLGVKQ